MSFMSFIIATIRVKNNDIHNSHGCFKIMSRNMLKKILPCFNTKWYTFHKSLWCESTLKHLLMVSLNFSKPIQMNELRNIRTLANKLLGKMNDLVRIKKKIGKILSNIFWSVCTLKQNWKFVTFVDTMRIWQGCSNHGYAD